MVHDLQEHVEDIRVRLLDLVEEEHGVRMLEDGIAEQAGLVVAHIARRGTDETSNAVPLQVLAHIEADQGNTEQMCELPGEFGFAHPGRTRKEERTDGFFLMTQAGAGEFDGGAQFADGAILAENHQPEIALEILEGAAVVDGNRLTRNACHLCHHFLDIVHADTFLAPRRRQQRLGRPYLIDNIDGLVGQMTIVDVFDREFHRRPQGSVGVAQVVVIFELPLQAAENFKGLVGAGFRYVDFLEATTEGTILLKMLAEFLIGSRSDAAQLACGKGGLEQIGGIHCPTRDGTRTDDGMDLVDEKDGLGLALQGLEHRLQALLEVAAITRAGNERTHIEGVDGRVAQMLGHAAMDDGARQTLDDGGLAHPRFANEEGVVLAPPRQNLQGPFQLLRTPDEGVDAPGPCQGIEVAGVGGEGILARFVAFLLVTGFLALVVFLIPGLAVGQIRHHIHARYMLFLQKIDGMGLALGKEGDQHIGTRDRLLARRLYVVEGALDDPLKADGGLAIDRSGASEGGDFFTEKALQFPRQTLAIGATGIENLHAGGVIEKGQQ